MRHVIHPLTHDIIARNPDHTVTISFRAVLVVSNENAIGMCASLS